MYPCKPGTTKEGAYIDSFCSNTNFIADKAI